MQLKNLNLIFASVIAGFLLVSASGLFCSIANATDEGAVQDQSKDANNYALNAQNVAQIQELQETIKKLRGDIEQLQFASAKTKEQISKLSYDIEFRINKLEKEKEVASNSVNLNSIDEKLDTKANNSEKKTNDSAIGDSKSKAIQAQYQDAYKLIQNKKHKEAKVAMTTFVNKYPDSDLTASAYFWLGEIEMSLESFDLAAVNYLKGYQANPKGPRAPDNLLKLAKSLAALNKRQEACVSLNKMKKEFVNLSVSMSRQLNESLKQLNCE